MAKNNYILNHAKHNEKAFKYLDQESKYLDWVVTIAFYSALNYVKFKIFPLVKESTGNKKVFDNFELFAKSQSSTYNNKHEIILRLVREECPAIYSEYRKLKEMCWTSRYIHYETDRLLCNEAKKLHDTIKSYCIDGHS